MFRTMSVVALCAALAACGEPAAPVEERATALSGGLYELTAEVTDLEMLDKRAPATKLKLGDKQSVKACVAADGSPPAELFGEDGDKCEYKDKYIRNGRLSAQLACTRKGVEGQIGPSVNGSFAGDSFQATVTTGTYLYDHANYRLVQKVEAKRVGDCPREEAPAAT